METDLVEKTTRPTVMRINDAPRKRLPAAMMVGGIQWRLYSRQSCGPFALHGELFPFFFLPWFLGKKLTLRPQ